MLITRARPGSESPAHPESPAAYEADVTDLAHLDTSRDPKRVAADEADASIRSLCQQRNHEQELFGPWDAEREREFLREVYYVLINPRIGLIDSVKNRRMRSGRWTTIFEEALVASLDKKLQRLVHGHFDPQRALVDSTVGFARISLDRHAKSWKPSAEVRDRPVELPEDLPAAEPAERDDVTEDRMAEFEDRLKARRGVARTIMSADGIRHVLDLPHMTVPASREARDRLYSDIRADDDLVPAAAVEYVELLDDDLQASPDLLSEAGQLFTGWPLSQAERASAMNPRLLSQMALGSLAPLPRPGRDAVQRMRFVVRGASQQRGWVRLAVRLVDTWIDEFCAAVSDFDGRADADLAEEARAERARTWPKLAQAAIEFPGDPLRVNTISEVREVILRAYQGH